MTVVVQETTAREFGIVKSDLTAARTQDDGHQAAAVLQHCLGQPAVRVVRDARDGDQRA
ncbi:hypothetical protein [Streptomyces platensis]|uniref:hypothetical protein n=1 Tax=Streptomyces platensis TaxID=58346 RepID=UPI00130268B0|nr:hypothetical protein [Streptomyces platensis]